MTRSSHALIVCLVFTGGVAVPQSASAQVYGSVREAESGTPVAAATIGSSEAGLLAMTDSVGSYWLEGLDPGFYSLRIRRAGYAGRDLQLYVPSGAPVHLRIELEPRPIPLPWLWVRGSVDSELPGFSVGSRTAVEIGSRDVDAADARLSVLPGGPDHLSALIGGSVAADPESPTALHLRGGDAHQTGVLIDGAPSLVPYHVGGAFGALAPEAIASAELTGAAPSAALGGTLAGPIEFRTATPPSDRTVARGSLSPQSMRLAASAPVGSVRLLATARRIDPTIFSFAEPAGTGAEAMDAFGKLVADLGGGTLELFSFWTRDRVGFAPFGPDGEGKDAPWVPERIDELARLSGGELRHRFGWSGHTTAATWARPSGEGGQVTLQMFSSGLSAQSGWLEHEGLLGLTSDRALSGLRGEIALPSWSAGFTLEDDDAHYRATQTRLDPAGVLSEPSIDFDERQRRGVAFIETRPTPTDWLGLRLGLRGSIAEGRSPMLEPRLAARVSLGSRVSASVGYARTIQDVQSLRNPEFVTARLFAAEPPIGSRRPGIPTARADEVAVALEVGPQSGLSARVMGYARWFDGLVLVGAGTSRPFAVRPTDGVIGSGRARGLELSARWRGDSWRIGIDYGLASTTRSFQAIQYHPEFGARHSLIGRVAFLPAKDLTLHLSFFASSGRRTTPVEGLGDWETCQTLGGGCEIFGFPNRSGRELNALTLPAYLRLDVGVRKGSTVGMFGRRMHVEGFLRVGNVTDRANAFGYSRQSNTSALAPIPMLGRAAVAAGIDWSF